MIRRKLTKPLAATAATIALLAGSVSAGTYALWNHAGASDLPTPKLGRVFFGVSINGGAEGTITDLTNAANQKKAVWTDDAMDQLLIDNKEIAIPIRVRTLSQGNNGLRYTPSVSVPAADTLWGASAPKVFPVASAADCTVANAPASSSLSVQTPWQPAYSTSATADEDHWCLVASHDALPGDGVYDSGATAEGDSALDETLTIDSNEFGLITETAISATNLSPSLSVTFDPEIIRPGGTP